MINSFHQGEFVKAILEDRHINFASVAKAMEVSGGTFQKYFNSKVLSDKVLIGMSKALKFDVRAMVQDETARRTTATMPMKGNFVAEEAPAYIRKPVLVDDSVPGYDLTIHMHEYDEVAQLQLLKYLQQLRRKGASSATGS